MTQDSMTQDSMTQHTMNEFEQGLGAHSGLRIDDADRTRGEHLDELLEQVRSHSVRFLTDVPRAPRSLRVRAGEVSFDVEWADTQHGGATVTPVEPAANTESADAAAPSGESLVAPTVGVYYAAPEPGAAPFVTDGDTVVVGQQVAIVEAMKLMIPVQADRAGRITGVLKNNGDSVEYGEPLFSIVPADAV